MRTLEFREVVAAQGRYIRQTSGGMDCFAIVDILVEPVPESNLDLSWEVGLDQIPRDFSEACLAGVTSVLEELGVTCIGTRVRIVGGVHHPTDSKSRCYSAAMSDAFKSAIDRCGIIAEHR
jgi:hypothetical protein